MFKTWRARLSANKPLIRNLRRTAAVIETYGNSLRFLRGPRRHANAVHAAHDWPSGTHGHQNAASGPYPPPVTTLPEKNQGSGKWMKMVPLKKQKNVGGLRIAPGVG